MLESIKFWVDWGIYERDILFLGGSVEYTGEIVHHGLGYAVEKAKVSFCGVSLLVFMKRFKMGNAVICRFSSESGMADKLDGAALSFRENIVDEAEKNPTFFEFRMVRDFLLFIIFCIEAVIFFALVYCLWQYLKFSSVSALLMAVVSFICILFIKYLRFVCKSKDVFSYRARFIEEKDLED